MGPNQTYKLFHSKGNHKQNEKMTYTLGKISVNHVTTKGLISNIYRHLTQFNNSKQKTLSNNGQKI